MTSPRLNTINTNRVKVPTMPEQKDSLLITYCRICGLPLVNNCIQSIGMISGTAIADPENPTGLRFCEQCGEPTVYFQNKLLKTYREIQGLPEDDDKGRFDNDIPF